MMMFHYLTLRHTPFIEMIRSSIDFIIAWSLCWCLWVTTLGHTPFIKIISFFLFLFCWLHGCSIRLLIIIWHWGIPSSSRLSSLLLTSWLLNLFFDPYWLSHWGISPSLRLSVLLFDFIATQSVLWLLRVVTLGHALLH